MKGYFRKRNGKWSYTVDVGIDPKTGRRKQRTRSGFQTKKEAQRAAADFQHEFNNGLYVEEKDISFKDFSVQWLSIYEKENQVKPGTIRIRKHEISRLMDYFSNLKMKNITRDQFQKAIDDLKDRGFADNTIEGAFRTGKMIFRKAVELEVIKKDPTEFAYFVRTKKTVEEIEVEALPKYMEKEELALFLKAADEQGLNMDGVIFYVLAYSGMRVGELIALKWKDIDFNKNTVNINKTYYNPTNNTTKFTLVTPKTKQSVRLIALDDSIMQRLRKHKFEQNELKMYFRDTYDDQDFVFAKENGYPIFIKTIQNRMQRLLKLSKLNESLTPHSLRHTHTSLLAEAGVNLEIIMERLGHSDDKTTRNVYLHVTKEAKKEASQKFSELMESLLD